METFKCEPVPPDRPWFKFWPEGVPKSVEYPVITLHEALEEAAKKTPDKPLLIFFGKKITYRQMVDLASRFAGALSNLGLKKGDRVAVVLPNTPQFMIAYYGILKVGGIVVPVNPLYTEMELEHVLKDSGAKIVVALDMVYSRIKAVKDKTNIEHIIVTNLTEYMPALLGFIARLVKFKPPKIPPGEALQFKDLVKSPPLDKKIEIDSREDLAILMYTGGTTGVPKGAMLTHFNLAVNAVQTKLVGYVDENSISLAVLPWFHVYGMTVTMNVAPFTNCTVIVLPKFDPKMVFDAVKKYKPTHFPAVATMYIALMNHPEMPKYKEYMRSIKYCIAGAMALPVEVAKRWREITGAMIVEGYGLSEASPVTHVNPLDDLSKVKYGSIGIPLPDTDAKIMDLEKGEKEMKPGEPGELVVKGPQVGKGYWNMPEETAKTFRNGWLYTGDVAYMDEEGYFHIVDRKKDMINVGGLKVWPREVEEVIYTHPAVKMAAVVGIKDEYYGEVPKAFVVLKGEYKDKVKPEEIIEYCKGKMAKYKIPRQVEFRDELPTTIVGKVLRRKLKE